MAKTGVGAINKTSTDIETLGLVIALILTATGGFFGKYILFAAAFALAVSNGQVSGGLAAIGKLVAFLLSMYLTWVLYIMLKILRSWFKPSA